MFPELLQSKPSIAVILNVLSDCKTLDIFKNVACSNCDSDILLRKTKLTYKQYYSRMARLTKDGLIRKKQGRYYVTSFGKVFYNLQITAENTVSNYWKLKAIDSFDKLSKEEYYQFIDNLIDDYNIKEILKKEYSSSFSYHSTMNNVLIQKSPVPNYHHQQEQQEKHPSFKIILVEDDPDTLLTYNTFLMKVAHAEAYNIDSFTDSYEALNHFINLNDSYYDLLITDIRMPGLNGLELYQKMKAIDSNIKVIFLSALDGLQEMVSIFPDLGFSNIIKKPINQDDFLNKVKTVLLAD